MTVILFGWPMVRLASSRRSPNLSSAARRRKIRLSQNSIGEKNSRCRQPACLRSLAVKNGVKRASHFWPQVDRSSVVKASASSWRRSGLPHLRKALEHCWKSTPSLPQGFRQPVMLIEAHPGRERKIRADANKDPAPALVVDIEVVLHDP